MSPLQCLFCDQCNPAAAKFCNECGTPLHFKPCPQCDGVNGRFATACYRCGAAFSSLAGDVGAEPEASLNDIAADVAAPAAPASTADDVGVAGEGVAVQAAAALAAVAADTVPPPRTSRWRSPVAGLVGLGVLVSVLGVAAWQTRDADHAPRTVASPEAVAPGVPPSSVTVAKPSGEPVDDAGRMKPPAAANATETRSPPTASGVSESLEARSPPAASAGTESAQAAIAPAAIAGTKRADARSSPAPVAANGGRSVAANGGRSDARRAPPTKAARHATSVKAPVQASAGATRPKVETAQVAEPPRDDAQEVEPTPRAASLATVTRPEEPAARPLPARTSGPPVPAPAALAPSPCREGGEVDGGCDVRAMPKGN